MKGVQFRVVGGPYDGQLLQFPTDVDLMDPPPEVRWSGPMPDPEARRALLQEGKLPELGLYRRRPSPEDDGVFWLYDYVAE